MGRLFSFVSALALLAGAPAVWAVPLHVAAGSALEIRFSLPAAPILYTNDGMILNVGSMSGTATSLRLSVFNGVSLLGGQTGTGPDFYFASPTSGPLSASLAIERLDFSSFADASIDGVVRISPVGGYFDVDSQETSLVVGAWVHGSAIRTDSGYGAVVSSMSVSPIPEAQTTPLLAVGLALVVIRVRRAAARRGARGG
ncbi:MAG: hypothetical protein A2580_07545 [Hydrogenophilales bacterium RIFOXYD1_FULL_62_11]|nr:MAG: hypothetical protein A2580_07545 [Hydrogenophilales bacterium RIFOXYD1_FULL_62_11]